MKVCTPGRDPDRGGGRAKNKYPNVGAVLGQHSVVLPILCFNIDRVSPENTRHSLKVGSMLAHAGPTLNQPWVNVSCFLGGGRGVLIRVFQQSQCIRSPNVGLLLIHSLRLWSNVKPIMGNVSVRCVLTSGQTVAPPLLSGGQVARGLSVLAVSHACGLSILLLHL